MMMYACVPVGVLVWCGSTEMCMYLTGKVECDASVMDGHTLRHGAVGAVPGVKNPVLLARQILEAQSHPLPGGLVPPRWVGLPAVETFQSGLYFKCFFKVLLGFQNGKYWFTNLFF